MKKIALTAVILSIVLVLGACASTEQPADSNSTSSEASAQEATSTETEVTAIGEPLTIGLSTNALANIHNRHMFEGVKEIAESRGYKVITSN